MPIKVRVQNCQSIKDSTIEIDGFTVVSGANNSGKTALQRAIRAPFINAPVGALVRHGEKSLVVTLEFDDGQTLRFEKGSKVKPEYTINGGEPINPGREVPTELEAFGVVPVVVGKDKLWPQIATQFPSGQFSGPIFLLDRPGSLMAEVVADVERVGRLSQAMKLAKSDHKKAADKLKVRKEDQSKITEELEEFDGLDAAVDLAVAVESLLDDADKVQTAIGVLTALSDRYQARTEEVERLEGIEAVVVPSTEAIEEAQQVAVEIDALGKLADRRSDAQGTVDSLSGIEAVTVPGTDAIEEAVQTQADLAALTSLESRLSVAQAEEEKWAGAVAATEGLAIDGDDPRLAQIDKVEKGLGVLNDLLTRLETAQGEVERLAGELEEAEREAREANDALVVVLGDTEMCPTCQTPMGDTHLHGEVTG